MASTNDPPQSGRPKRKLPNEPEREIHSDQPPKRWRAIKTKVVLRTAGLLTIPCTAHPAPSKINIEDLKRILTEHHITGTADILPNQGGSGTTPVVPNTYRRPIHGWPPLQHNFLQPPQPDLLPTPQPNLLPTTQPIFYQQLSQISYQQLSQSSTNNSAKSSTNPSIRSPSNNSAQSFTTSRQSERPNPACMKIESPVCRHSILSQHCPQSDRLTMPLLKMSSWCARLKQILQYRIRLSPIFHSLTHLNLIRPQESLKILLSLQSAHAPIQCQHCHHQYCHGYCHCLPATKLTTEVMT
ncbi:hypothetical protein PSTT_05666 [Puccinia striiformis]|uniref:Uncharacterized protein n=1 Tax=Puccinia striiformis TaxID=27350 RepID=A0A2S4VN80_9BASI|nr:hypothetical protein PSTT_05666 [Puccinia striiformis]